MTRHNSFVPSNQICATLHLGHGLNKFLRALSISSPSCLVLKSPTHQPIHTTVPQSFCLSLNCSLSFLLALPLGCLSCSPQQGTSGTPCLSTWPFPRCCAPELQLITLAGKCKLPGPQISLAFRPLAETLGVPLPAWGSHQSSLYLLPSLPGEKKRSLPFS